MFHRKHLECILGMDSVDSFTISGGGGGGDSTLIRLVCATGVLNLSPCFGVGKPKKDTLFWSYHSIVLYCIVLETKIMFTLYLFNQMSLPFPFSSIMFVQKNFKFSTTVISFNYDICIAFQD